MRKSAYTVGVVDTRVEYINTGALAGSGMISEIGKAPLSVSNTRETPRCLQFDPHSYRCLSGRDSMGNGGLVCFDVLQLQEGAGFSKSSSALVRIRKRGRTENDSSYIFVIVVQFGQIFVLQSR